MNRFIVRVDDVGQAVDQSQPDIGLAYFIEWLNAGSWWPNVRLHLGVVPGVMSSEDIASLKNIARKHSWELCIHGWNHSQCALSSDHIESARDRLGETHCVIPPYNMYDEDTLSACARLLEDPVLLGGFDGEDHEYGIKPALVRGVAHFSADKRLYDRCYRLAPLIETLPAADYPLMVTLHHRWDAMTLNGAGELAKALAHHTINAREVAHALRT